VYHQLGPHQRPYLESASGNFAHIQCLRGQLARWWGPPPPQAAGCHALKVVWRGQPVQAVQKNADCVQPADEGSQQRWMPSLGYQYSSAGSCASRRRHPVPACSYLAALGAPEQYNGAN
jgi:hypothetical protein